MVLFFFFFGYWMELKFMFSRTRGNCCVLLVGCIWSEVISIIRSLLWNADWFCPPPSYCFSFSFQWHISWPHLHTIQPWFGPMLIICIVFVSTPPGVPLRHKNGTCIHLFFHSKYWTISVYLVVFSFFGYSGFCFYYCPIYWNQKMEEKYLVPLERTHARTQRERGGGGFLFGMEKGGNKHTWRV